MSTVSPQQLRVIIALSEGRNSIDAAAQAGVHRNTIAHWRRTSLEFREALAQAHYDRALFFREQAEDRIDLAWKTLHNVMTDSTASPSVRLKAAIFIIEKAITPSPLPAGPNDQVVHLVHNDAQCPAPAAGPGTTETVENPPSVHTGEPTPIRPIHRDGPKVGRNELCPCGSGRKHKRCCLDQPLTRAA